MNLLFLAGCTTSPERPSQRTCFHLNKAFESDVGYCQALRSGQTLYISGTAAGGDMADVVASVYTDLGNTLAANGLSFADVVKENVYSTELDAFIQNKAIRKQYYTDKQWPAASWIQVDRLFSPGLVLEVELVAKYPE